jgi:hypothetical protein
MLNLSLSARLCHKPVGGGGRDSAVQQSIFRPVGVLRSGRKLSPPR